MLNPNALSVPKARLVDANDMAAASVVLNPDVLLVQ